MNIVETQDVINIEEHGIAMNAIKTEGVWWIGAHWATADLKKEAAPAGGDATECQAADGPVHQRGTRHAQHVVPKTS